MLLCVFACLFVSYLFTTIDFVSEYIAFLMCWLLTNYASIFLNIGYDLIKFVEWKGSGFSCLVSNRLAACL